ncbi:GGDEF domain-containing protein [Persephonella sp.]
MGDRIVKSIFSNTVKYFEQLKDCKGMNLNFLENLKEEEISELISKSFYKDSQEIKRTFFVVGKDLYKKSVPFNIIIDLIEFIENSTISDFELSDDVSNEIFKSLRDYFENIKNSVSYGYLQEMIKSDKDIIRQELRSVKDGNTELRPFLRDYLIWVNKLTEDIRKLRTCDVQNNKQWKITFKNLDDKEYISSLLNKDEVEILRDVHNRLLSVSSSIYYSIENRKFALLTLNYMELIKLLGKLISLATVNIAARSLEGINIDHLTGLLNRKAMDFILNSQYQIAKLTGKPLSIVMLDIDDFKSINDRYGHVIGDCVLQKFAKELQENLRKSDFIFRYGGEEFLILMPFTEKRDACNVIKNLLEKITDGYICCNEDLYVSLTFSAGIEDISCQHESVIDIIKQADRKMYRAKSSGKSQVVC